MAPLMLWLLLFVRTIKSHTIAVCTSVSADGRSVTIYAGNYHSVSDISANALKSGLVLTDPHGADTEYLFDGYIARGSVTNGAGLPIPPACATMYCDCSHCSGRSDVTYWLKRDEPSLFDGDYEVVPTSHTFVEEPYHTCVTPWTFTISGSIATASPTGPSTPPTEAPSAKTDTENPTSAPTDACTSDADCGPNAECEDILKHCTCWDGYIGDPQNGVDCELDCPHGNHTKTFNWDTLTEQGIDIPQYDMKSFTILPDILAIDITIELDYLGNVTADDDRVGKFGVTYVLDFEDFDAHEDNIADPGTCQNRVESDFTAVGVTFDDYWDWSPNPQAAGNLGTTSYLAYPPPGDLWNIHIEDCGKIIYSGIFTWEDLRGCNDGNGGNSYTEVVTDDNWLNLTGTFYVNVVSPFWPDQDFGYYRVYQILSQPFVIAVSSVVHVLGSTGINLMTLSVIAVYKEDADNDFVLVLLTETADYLKLTRDATSLFIYTKSDPANVLDTSDFDGKPINPENTLANGNECLSNKNFICSQLWEINATNIGCTNGGLGTDFSGNYQLSFTPVCRSTGDALLDGYCANWLTAHPGIASGVALDTDLVWTDDICDPIIFLVQFVADMTFYVDAGYTTEADDEHLYQVGEDYIYVQINTTFPDDTLDVFNVSLVNVRICTFDPLFNVPDDPDDIANFGCMNGARDDYDKFFYKIYDEDPAITNNPTFSVEGEGFSNVVRFSFQVPHEVARDTLYVQAELEVALQELGGRRRTRRLSIETETANQMQSFVDKTGINHGQKIYYQPKEEPKQQPQEQPRQNPPEQYYPPQQPIQPVNPVAPVSPVVVPNPGSATWTINLSSPWVIALGGLLGLVLTFNIAFMTYANCCRGSRDRPLVLFGKKKGYKKVKFADSEDFDDSEANAINVVSDE